MPTFRVRTVLGDRPSHIPAGVLAFVAPRYLHGVEAELHPAWGWVGQVIVDPLLAETIERNCALDAEVVIWRDRDEAVAAAKAELLNRYAGDEMAAELIDEMEPDELLSNVDLRFTVELPGDVDQVVTR